ncbi:MAG: hypothetical protein Q9178_005262 [Gyalolechia marmorata]
MEGRAKFSRMYKPPDPISKALQDYNRFRLSPSRESITGWHSSTMLRRILPIGHKPRICVVGAGVAGLRSERSGRGPNWIHGLKENPILDLGKELGDALMDVPEIAPSVYDQAGNLLSTKEGRECSDLMWAVIEEAFTYSDQDAGSIPQNQSLLDFFKLKLNEKNVPDVMADRVLELWNVFLASTYKAILDRMTKDVVPKADLQLSTKVTSVSSSAFGGDTSEAESITVVTSHNKVTSFEEVVMTAPLGWLKRNSNTFQPALPPRIQIAIKNLSYGALEKVYLTFPLAFWLSHHDQENPQPFFNQWLTPEYTTHHWAVECAFLSSLPAPHSDPTLLFYMHGPLARHITTLTSKLDSSSSGYLTTLTDFFKPYYSLLPNYDPTSPSCSPSHALATEWQNDEFAGWGSYSNFQISDPEIDGKVELDKDIEALRKGAPERRLWFAGEHTAPFVALGTVTGAWWSGEGVAKRILNAYGLDATEEVGDAGAGEGMAAAGVGVGKVAVKRGGTGLGA